MMNGMRRTRRSVAVASVVVAAAVVLAGCGTKASSTSQSPASSPKALPSQGSLAGLAALAGYLGQVRPVATQLGSTVSALPEAVKGLSTKPNGSWTTASTKLKAISSQLGAEAATLAALSPPALLRPAQDAAVKAITDARSAVANTASTLGKRTATKGTAAGQIQSQIGALTSRLSQLGQQLIGTIAAAIASPASTPTP
jgi:hypothetical protein